MKTFAKIKQWLVGGCVWYALISLPFLIARVALFNKNTTNSFGGIPFLLMFPFGLSMSVAGMIYKGNLPRWSRILLHYIISVVAFLLFILLPASKRDQQSVTVLLWLVLLTIIYWILFALVHIFQVRWKRVVEED